MTIETQSLPQPVQPKPATLSADAPSHWARTLLVRRLAGLEGAHLKVSDRWGRWSAGEAGATVLEVEVHDPAFYLDVLLGGSLGAGRSYVEGRWSTGDLPGLLRLFLRNEGLTDALEGGLATAAGALSWLRHKLRRNTRDGARFNIHAHYDLGNDFFALFLDPTLTYSAAVFETRDATLEQASNTKLDRICRKLELRAEHHLLEIGTGWGSFALHAAQHYGCRVTTTTISDAQHRVAAQRVARAGLEARVEVLKRDYRDLEGRFDRLVSIEMIEAVGHEYLPGFFDRCERLLDPEGVMVLQAITMPDHRYAQYLRSSDFIRELVFPGSCCPSLGALQQAAASRTALKLVGLEDIGQHYAETLRRWRSAFLANRTQVRGLGYPETLVRLWDYYFAYCEAGFAERYISDVQLVYHGAGRRLPVPLPSLGETRPA